MYIKVRLFNGFSEPLWYEQPDHWPQEKLIGAIVLVPLRNQQMPALVIEQQQRKPQLSFAIRPATAIEPVPDDSHYQSFIRQVSVYYQITPLTLIKRIKQFLFQKEVTGETAPQEATTPPHPITLTEAQQAIVTAINPAISDPLFMPSLLHGVTGSGILCVVALNQ